MPRFPWRGDDRVLATRTKGFTLIETMLAVLILGLLSGAAVWSFARPINNARANQAIDLLHRTDAMAREQAQRAGVPVQIQFDLSAQTIQRGDVVSHLPANFTLRQIRINDRLITDGDTTLTVSALGLSPSYALNITTADRDVWLLFAGLSGEISQTTDASQIEQLLARASRHDAR